MHFMSSRFDPRPRASLCGVLLLWLAACTAPPLAPPGPAPIAMPESAHAAPGTAPASPAAAAAPSSAYLWSDPLAAVARKLRSELPADRASVTQSPDQRVWISLPVDAMFPGGRSGLLPQATPWLDKIAAAARDMPRSELQVLGDGDLQGRETRASAALALDRAASARDWMVARGVAARRIAVGARAAAPGSPARDTQRLDILIGERAPKSR